MEKEKEGVLFTPPRRVVSSSLALAPTAMSKVVVVTPTSNSSTRRSKVDEEEEEDVSGALLGDYLDEGEEEEAVSRTFLDDLMGLSLNDGNIHDNFEQQQQQQQQQQHHHQLLNKIAHLETILHQSQNRCQLAENAFVILEERCENYELTITALQTQNNELKNELEESLLQNDTLYDEVDNDNSMLMGASESEQPEVVVDNNDVVDVDDGESWRKSRELEQQQQLAIIMEEEKKSLQKQNGRLEATINLLVEEYRTATEKLVDAGEEILDLTSSFKEVHRKSMREFQELPQREAEHNRNAAVLHEQNSRLETTVDLLVEDYRNTTEKLVDVEDAYESLREIHNKSMRESRELQREAEHRNTALHDQNSRLEATVDLLVEDNRNTTEKLMDLEEERELLKSMEGTIDLLAKKLVDSDGARESLKFQLREANDASRRQSRELERVAEHEKALNKQNSRLEATVDLLVADWRNSTEKLIDAEEVRESLDSALREAIRECQEKSRELERAEERQTALDEQNIRLEATVDLLVEDYRYLAEELVDAEEELDSLNSALRDVDSECRMKSRELERAGEHQAALDKQNVGLEATVDLLVQDYRDATEDLVDAKEECESLDSALKVVSQECSVKSRLLEQAEKRQAALHEHNYRLEATVDLLVEDYRNATEKLMDGEDARETFGSSLRKVQHECWVKAINIHELAAECQAALGEQITRLEATVDLLLGDYCNATEKLGNADDASESLESRLKGIDLKLQVKTQEPERAAPEEVVVAEDGSELIREISCEPQRTAQKPEREFTRQIKALNEQNSRLEATIELLVEDLQSATEKLVDAEDEVKASAAQSVSLTTELLHLDSVLREVSFESQMKSRELERSEEHHSALNEQQSRLEATVNLLVDDLRNVSEKLVDMEDERESMEVKCQKLERAAAERQNALYEQISSLEATVNSLGEDNRNAIERLLDTEDKLANATFVGSDARVSQLEEEKEILQKEVAKINKERFQVMDRANNCDKQHRAANQKLNEKLKASTQQVDLLQKSMREAATKHMGKIQDLVTEMAQLRKEAENATLSVAELTAHRDKLSTDLERSISKNAELESVSVKSEECARNVASYSEALDAEKKNLEVKLSECVQSHKELTQRHMDSETNIQRMSGEVVFTHEEISRLSMEKEAIIEESILQVECANFKSDECARNLASYSEALDAEKTNLEVKFSKLVLSHKELARRYMDSEANVQRMSGEVVFIHEEISRLSMEKEEIMEESESQLQHVNGRLKELQRENQRKIKEFKELWTKSNTLLLEKESALSVVKRLQHERDEESIRVSKEQGELSEKIEKLQNENKQQQQKMETMMEAESILREMNKLLEHEKDMVLSLLTKEKEALVAEKEAIMEESALQLQKVNDCLNKLREENKRKSKDFQKLWTKSNTSLLEKESAMAMMKQFQHEKVQQSIIPSKAQVDLSGKVEELQNENKYQKQQIESLIEAEGFSRANLSAKVAQLQSENKKHLQHIESLIEAEKILREMLKSEKEVLWVEIEYLRQENTAIADEMVVLTNTYSIEKDRMQSEEEDLTWKIDALTQNTRLRLKEKDATISRLDEQIQSQLNEINILKNEIYKRDAERNAFNLNVGLPDLERLVIENQQAELDQMDMVRSDLGVIKTRSKSETLRMQSKVNKMERWLRGSSSSDNPPISPSDKYPHPQSTQESPFKCSNPQSSPKSHSEEFSSTYNFF